MQIHVEQININEFGSTRWRIVGQVGFKLSRQYVMTSLYIVWIDKLGLAQEVEHHYFYKLISSIRL